MRSYSLVIYHKRILQTLGMGILLAPLLATSSARAEAIMCKIPKSFVCEATGCLPAVRGPHDEDVLLVDIAEKHVTLCFGKDGRCTKSSVTVEAGDNAYFLGGPAMVLRLTKDERELTMALTTHRRVVAQFFQCGKP